IEFDRQKSNPIREHPDPNVDVAAIHLTEVLRAFPDLQYKSFLLEHFATKERLAEHDVGVGDEVLLVGYPLGIRQGNTNHGVLRRGMISSQIGLPFQSDKTGPALPAFLIDGGV